MLPKKKRMKNEGGGTLLVGVRIRTRGPALLVFMGPTREGSEGPATTTTRKQQSKGSVGLELWTFIIIFVKKKKSLFFRIFTFHTVTLQTKLTHAHSHRERDWCGGRCRQFTQRNINGVYGGFDAYNEDFPGFLLRQIPLCSSLRRRLSPFLRDSLYFWWFAQPSSPNFRYFFFFHNCAYSIPQFRVKDCVFPFIIYYLLFTLPHSDWIFSFFFPFSSMMLPI